MAQHGDTPGGRPVTALLGKPVPPVRLDAGRGRTVDLAGRRRGWLIVWCFPGIEQHGWSPDEFAARSLEEHRLEYAALEATVVGVSSQDRRALDRLAARAGATFAFFSDLRIELAHRMRLPTIEREGRVLYQRLVLIVRGGRVAWLIYPARPLHCAGQTVRWLSAWHHKKESW